MTPADKLKEWLTYYAAIHTDESKFALFASLKRSKVAADREALQALIKRWLAE